jgi:hypothetical protein
MKRGRILPEVHSVQFGVSILVHETVFRHDKFNTTYDLQKRTLNIHNLSLHEILSNYGDVQLIVMRFTAISYLLK